MLRDAFGIEPGGVDLPTFPPFALFDPALGLTSIIPDMDPTRPGAAPIRAGCSQAIERFGVTQLFGSPALVARAGAARRAAADGAARDRPPARRCRPTSSRACANCCPTTRNSGRPTAPPNACPSAVIEGRELQATRDATERGAGTCVGRPVPPNEVRIIRIDDDADRRMVRRAARAAGPGRRDHRRRPDRHRRVLPPRRRDRAGEDPRDAAPTAASASCTAWATSAGSTREGRLWFCGRKTQRVVDRRHDDAVHRAGRAGLQHASRRAPHRAGRRRRARRATAGAVRRAASRASTRSAATRLVRRTAPHRRRLRAHRRACTPSCSTRASRSTSATTPRSAARSSRRWAATRGTGARSAHEGPGHRRRRFPRPGAVPRPASNAASEVVSFNRGLVPRARRAGRARRCRATSPIAMRCSHAGARASSAIFHNAAKAGAWGSYDELPPRERASARDNVLAACRAHGIARLVYTSTPSVTHRATHPVEGGTADTVPYGDRFKAPYATTKTHRRASGARGQRRQRSPPSRCARA